jgi:hypothetical protein
MLKRTMVVSLMSGLFAAGAAMATPVDSSIELDPRIRAAEEARYRLKKDTQTEAARPAKEAGGVERKFEFLDRYNPS